MAWPSISAFQADPVFFNMLTHHQLDWPVFAMKLVANGSELTLGGLNSALYTGDMTYITVTDQGYWKSTFDGLYVGGKRVGGKNSCIIDSVRIHYYVLTPPWPTYSYREVVL
jgi:hypothetical protein